MDWSPRKILCLYFVLQFPGSAGAEIVIIVNITSRLQPVTSELLFSYKLKFPLDKGLGQGI